MYNLTGFDRHLHEGQGHGPMSGVFPAPRVLFVPSARSLLSSVYSAFVCG